MTSRPRAKNKRLPDAITSDAELERWCKANVPQFAGVVSATDFPALYARMRQGDSAIVNLDPGYKRGGTHWVAIKRSGEGAPITYYKDSFGAPPPRPIVETVGGGLVYGTRINQRLSEENCGRRAAEWLRDMAAAAKAGREIEQFEASEL